MSHNVLLFNFINFYIFVFAAAASSMTGPIGFIIIPFLMQLYGRRFINVFWNLFPLAGAVIIAMAPSASALFAGRCIQGISFCSMFITSVVIAEYSHPKRRGSFVVLKVAFIHLGAVICHGLIFVLHWRQIAWLSVAPPALGIISTIVWPESPSWLAYRGRYDECIKSFQWLRGEDFETREETKELIIAQRHLRQMKKDTNNFVDTVNAFRSKDFWKPMAVSTVLTFLMHACGIHYLTAYIIEIMMQLTNDASKAYYYTIGFDIVKIISMMVSAITVRKFNRRALLLVGGGVACIILGLICIFHYLKENGTVRVTWIGPLLLILFICINNVGVVPISIVIFGEIFPLKYKGIGLALSGIINALTSVAAVKLTAMMLTSLNTHGTFAVYLIISIGCLVFLYFIQPETKDRTLQDIENEIVGLKLDDDDKDAEMTTIVK